MSDREFIAEMAEAIAVGTNALFTARCGTEGCHYAVYTASQQTAEAAYAEHLRIDPRHTGGEWIDRDGRERIGLDYAGKATP